MSETKMEVFIHRETAEAFIVQFLSPGLWSIQDENERRESLTTVELLTKFLGMGILV